RATASEAAPAHLLGAVDSRRALRVGAALVLLLWPWPGAGRVCSAVFALYADAVVQSLPLGSAAAAPRISSPTEAQRREAGVADLHRSAGAFVRDAAAGVGRVVSGHLARQIFANDRKS